MVALCKGFAYIQHMLRPLCATCNTNLCAVNYLKHNVPHYRKQCDACIRKGKKLKPAAPQWYRAGYRKKSNCELCGYRAKYPDKQLAVFHIDGNLKNCIEFNLKTVCLNCKVELAQKKTPWRESPLTPDF